MPPDIDTSTYPKYEQKGFLDKAQQFQAVESNAIGINAQKLKLVNEQFGLINNELGKLANEPNISKEQAAQRLDTFTKTFNLPPQVRQHMLGELQSSPDVKSFAENAIRRGMSTMEAVNFQYGTPGMVNTGAAQVPVATSPKTGVRQIGAPIQQQLGPGQLNTPIDVQDENGVTTKQPLQKFIQDTGGTTQAPGQIAPAATQAGPRPSWAAPPAAAAPTGRTGVAGVNPQFEQGKTMLSTAQADAGRIMQAVKPAEQALQLMKGGILSGPGSDQFTKAIALGKTFGLIDTAIENDPTAVRQMVTKKLSDYISSNPIGQRSDAAQTLREAASPNPGAQIFPALEKLTKDAITLDRVRAAMPNAFKDKDLSKFGKHQATFPQSVDERAFGLDMNDNAPKLINEMKEKLNSKDAKEKAAATKFFRSLRIADDQGYYSGQ